MCRRGFWSYDHGLSKAPVGCRAEPSRVRVPLCVVLRLGRVRHIYVPMCGRCWMYVSNELATVHGLRTTVIEIAGQPPEGGVPGAISDIYMRESRDETGHGSAPRASDG